MKNAELVPDNKYRTFAYLGKKFCNVEETLHVHQWEKCWLVPDNKFCKVEATPQVLSDMYIVEKWWSCAW